MTSVKSLKQNAKDDLSRVKCESYVSEESEKQQGSGLKEARALVQGRPW